MLKIGDKIRVKRPTNQGAQWAVEDGDVTMGNRYEVERQEGPEVFLFRDNTGKLTSVANFEWVLCR